MAAVTSKRARRLKWGKSNYCDLTKCDVRIGRRAQRKTTTVRNGLYPVEILEACGDRVKVHYVGYSKKYDEWKERGDVEDISTRPEDTSTRPEPSDTVPLYRPYSFYDDLKFRVKKSITCSLHTSPKVKITMPVDVLLFNGGLKMAGTPIKMVGGVQYYGIHKYRDINHLLGDNWHYRGLNNQGDYGYAIRNTVQFYVKKYRPLIEYVPSSNGSTTKCSHDVGYYLHFSFVQGYGNATTFGIDRDIFG